jgi:hypothetical protein
LEFTQSLSPRATPLTRSRGMLAHLLLEFTPDVSLLAFLSGVGGLWQKEAIYLRAYKAPYGKLPIMSIENPTLAHFRHFSHFRHSVPRSFPTDCTILKSVRIITYFQTHSFLTNKPNFFKGTNERKLTNNNGL